MPSSGVQKCALRSEEHPSELQSHDNLVCRLLLEKTKTAHTILERFTRAPPRDRLPAAPPRHGCVWPSFRERARIRVRARDGVLFTIFFLKDRAPPKIYPFPPPAPFPI